MSRRFSVEKKVGERSSSAVRTYEGVAKSVTTARRKRDFYIRNEPTFQRVFSSVGVRVGVCVSTFLVFIVDEELYDQYGTKRATCSC